MSKKDYIEKITQNLEHLTKDELKDVSILTTAQYGVRLKVAEKEYIEKEIANLTPQLQQQALLVVPECVGNFLKGKSIFGIANGDIPDDVISWVQEQTYYVDLEKIISHLIIIKVTGFTVEKPQQFYIELPNVYGLSDSVFVSKVENETILEFTKGKDYALAFTEQEIKSIDERYWQFSVPVEDGE